MGVIYITIYNEEAQCILNTSCTPMYELLQSSYDDNQEDTLFSWLHMSYSHLASVRFEHIFCRGLHLTTDGYIWFLHVLLKVQKVFWTNQNITVLTKC